MANDGTMSKVFSGNLGVRVDFHPHAFDLSTLEQQRELPVEPPGRAANGLGE